MSLIELNNVSVGFGAASTRTEVLRDINLTINEGELVAIVGYSGSGKSTLVNLIAGLVKPDKGAALFDGKAITGPGPERGLVFQTYALLPWLSVKGNVALAVNQVCQGESLTERNTRIADAVDQVKLTPAMSKLPGELSGGMRQRVSVARALSFAPRVLLLDEPLSALDALTRSELQDQILELKQRTGQTILLITNIVYSPLPSLITTWASSISSTIPLSIRALIFLFDITVESIFKRANSVSSGSVPVKLQLLRIQS